jgi:hypothetical protein
MSADRPQAGAELANVSRAYDTAMRLPSAGGAALVAAVSVGRPARDIGGGDPALPNTVYPINISIRLSTIAFRVHLAELTIFAETPEAEGPRDRHHQRWRG